MSFIFPILELFQSRGEWCARLKLRSGTWITIGYDHDNFIQVLTEVRTS